MSLTKAQILAVNDFGLLEVPVPEWGGSVFIRVISVGDRDSYELEYSQTGGNIPDFRTKFLAKCLADDKGQRLFTDAEIEMLRERNSRVMHRLFREALKHNDLDESKVQEAAKNS